MRLGGVGVGGTIVSRLVRRIWAVFGASVLVAFVCVAAIAVPAPASPTIAGFEPYAASFVSPSIGFVLGTRGCQFKIVVPCPPVVMTTTTGGASWRRVAAPATVLRVYPSGVGTPSAIGITFADPRNGWLIVDGDLWATHDGGARWTRVHLTTPVASLVASAGWAYADPFATAAKARVLRSPVGHDDWAPVAGLPEAWGAEIAVSGGAAFVSLTLTMGGASGLWATADGVHWQRLANPCPHAAPFQVQAATSPQDVFIDCNAQQLAISTDGGAHATLTNMPQGDFIGSNPVVAPLGQADTAVTTAPFQQASMLLPRRLRPSKSFIYRTTDGGRTWAATSYADHGAGFADLQFVSPTVGWIIHGYPGGPADQLLHTANAGATFTPVAF